MIGVKQATKQRYIICKRGDRRPVISVKQATQRASTRRWGRIAHYNVCAVYMSARRGRERQYNSKDVERQGVGTFARISRCRH